MFWIFPHFDDHHDMNETIFELLIENLVEFFIHHVLDIIRRWSHLEKKWELKWWEMRSEMERETKRTNNLQSLFYNTQLAKLVLYHTTCKACSISHNLQMVRETKRTHTCSFTLGRGIQLAYTRKRNTTYALFKWNG